MKSFQHKQGNSSF